MNTFYYSEKQDEIIMSNQENYKPNFVFNGKEFVRYTQWHTDDNPKNYWNDAYIVYQSENPIKTKCGIDGPISYFE